MSSKKIVVTFVIIAVVLPIVILVIGKSRWDNQNAALSDYNGPYFSTKYDTNYFVSISKITKSFTSFTFGQVDTKNYVRFIFPHSAINEPPRPDTLGDKLNQSFRNANYQVVKKAPAGTDPDWIQQKYVVKDSMVRAEMIEGKWQEVGQSDSSQNSMEGTFYIISKFPTEPTSVDVFLKKRADLFFHLKKNE